MDADCFGFRTIICVLFEDLFSMKMTYNSDDFKRRTYSLL